MFRRKTRRVLHRSLRPGTCRRRREEETGIPVSAPYTLASGHNVNPTMDLRHMRRHTLPPVKVMLALALAAVVPQQASGPRAMQAGQTPAAAPPEHVQNPARHFSGAGRARGHAVGRVADAAQPDQHRHRPRRPHLGGRRRALPLAPRPPARRRSHRRPARTPTATARPTRRTRSCRSRRSSRRSASRSSTTRSSSRSRPT